MLYAPVAAPVVNLIALGAVACWVGVGLATMLWIDGGRRRLFVLGGALVAGALVALPLGVLADTVLTGVGNLALDDQAAALADGTLSTGLGEEAAKLATTALLVSMLRLGTRRRVLLVAAAVSLGFAGLENLGYLAAEGGETVLGVALLVALRLGVSGPGHLVYGMLGAAALLDPVRARTWTLPRRLALASLAPVMHAAYNGLVGLPSVNALVLLALLVLETLVGVAAVWWLARPPRVAAGSTSWPPPLLERRPVVVPTAA